MATHSSVLPGKAHGQRSLEGYSPWGHERAGHDWAGKQFLWVLVPMLMTFYIGLCFILTTPHGRHTCPAFVVVLFSCQGVSNSLLLPRALKPARLLCSWDFPGKNTGVDNHFSFSRGSSQPRDGNHASCLAGGFFYPWATREALAPLKNPEKEANRLFQRWQHLPSTKHHGSG